MEFALAHVQHYTVGWTALTSKAVSMSNLLQNFTQCNVTVGWTALSTHQSFSIVYLSNQLVNIFLAGPNSSKQINYISKQKLNLDKKDTITC